MYIYSVYPEASRNWSTSNLGFSTEHIWAIRFIVSFVAFVVFSISAIALKCFLVIVYHRVCLYKVYALRLHRNILRRTP